MSATAWLRLFAALLCLAVSEAGAAEFLHPAVAFKPTARALDGETIEVRFEIAKGYYLYRDKFRFAAKPATTALGAPLLPPGKEKFDESFGTVQVYFGEALIRVPVERNSSGRLPLVVEVTSQGCADGGVCYPPQQQTLKVDLPDPVATPRTPPAPAGADESGRIARALGEASLAWIVASFFGFGLLLSMTPCVFPMIPIVSGIIVGSGGERVSAGRGFVLSLAYVLGMATTYAALGVAAGKTGVLLSASLQNAWVLGAFALVFVVLACSMFGLYELQLPSFVSTRLSPRQRAGSPPAIALMGALSALIVGPCVAAPLAGALLYIGRTGDALLGGVALFFLALGMGVPLLVVGASAGRLLPRSGPWMDSVKKVFGVILLATALWFVAPLLPLAVQMGAWAILLIVPAIALRAIDPLPAAAGSAPRLAKGVGIVMLFAGAAMVVGALSGAKDPLQPLAGLTGSASEAGVKFTRIKSLAEFDALRAASAKPVVLDFYADWCVSCKEMERYTFSDKRVQEKLRSFTLLQADVTADSADDRALLARFKLYGPPAMIFFNAAGKEVDGVRVVGYQKAEDFLNTIAAAAR